MSQATTPTTPHMESLEGRAFLTAAHGFVYTPHSVVDGKSLGQWSAEWVKWALGTDASKSPLTDTTGKNSGVSQPKDVFFLAGTLGGGDATRKATIPANTPVFFPVLNDFWVNINKDVPPDVKADPPFAGNEKNIRGYFDDTAKGYSNAFATVDGNPVFSMSSHLEEDPKGGFQVKFPKNNLFGLPAEILGKSATQGLYLMLRPLSPGTHTIHFGGVSKYYNPDVALDVTYKITVKGNTPSAVPVKVATTPAAGTSVASSVLEDQTDG